MIQDVRKHPANHRSTDRAASDVIDAVWSQLEQFLAAYDVHLVQHQFEDAFDPRQMKPVKWVLSNNRTADGRVFESLQPGFRMGQGQMLRFEAVSLVKYQPATTEPIIQIERKNENE